MVSRTIGRQVFNSPQSFWSLSSCYTHGRRWWFEDHVYIRAATPWAHEAAPQPAEREAQSLGPDECLHVQFGVEVAPLEPRRRLHGATKAAGADAPAKPICLSQRFD
jgi:hypothetical protein